MNLLKQCPEWFVDGTFDVCPTIFAQLYTVHVKLPEGNVVPVAYAFLPSKSGASFTWLLEVPIDALDGFEPQAVRVDFEMKMIEELEKVCWHYWLRVPAVPVCLATYQPGSLAPGTLDDEGECHVRHAYVPGASVCSATGH